MASPEPQPPVVAPGPSAPVEPQAGEPSPLPETAVGLPVPGEPARPDQPVPANGNGAATNGTAGSNGVVSVATDAPTTGMPSDLPANGMDVLPVPPEP